MVEVNTAQGTVALLLNKSVMTLAPWRALQQCVTWIHMVYVMRCRLWRRSWLSCEPSRPHAERVPTVVTSCLLCILLGGRGSAGLEAP